MKKNKSHLGRLASQDGDIGVAFNNGEFVVCRALGNEPVDGLLMKIGGEL